jgi:hypothetical protein
MASACAPLFRNEVKRVEGRLSTLLARLKRSVMKAECTMFSRLEWEKGQPSPRDGAPSGQIGRIHMRLERVEVTGPVNVSANINRHAQLVSTLGSLVTRKIAMLPHSQVSGAEVL